MAVAALVAGYRKRFGGVPRMASGGAIPPSVTFPTSRLATRVYVALGANLTDDYLTWNWLDITQRVRHDLGITITVGRGDERGQVTPSRCQIKIDNNDGAFCRHNPLSPYFELLSLNTPIWIQLDPGSGFVDRYFGFVNDWPTTWADESGNDAFVTIQCTGVMGRLTQGNVLRSPVYRSISGFTPGALKPLAYWPMEDNSGSTQFASAIPGVAGAAPAGTVTYAANSDLPGSSSLPTLAAGTTVTFPVPTYTITNAWVVHLVINVPSAPGSDTVLASVITDVGDIVQYDLLIRPSAASLVLRGYNAAGTTLITATLLLDGSTSANPLPADFYGNTWAVRIVEKINVDSPTDVLGFLFLSSISGDTAQAVDTITGTASTAVEVKLWSYTATNGISFGHVAVHADAAFIQVGSVTAEALASVGALSGWSGEQGHERVKRLCREEGITARTLAASSAAMGAQGSGTLLAELRACEAADQGFLFEEKFGVAFQSLSERYNAPVALNLDFASKHIAGVPVPADNTQRLINKFTSGRTGGSSATAEQRDGPLGTTKSGVFEGSTTINVESDNQLQSHAGMKVRLGTVNEVRWPQLAIRLHRTPDLIPGWLAALLGARLNVANPPNPLSSATIDAFLEGYTERWDPVSWVAALNTSPASPYDVAVAGDSTTAGAWLQTGVNTQLAADVASGATSLTVTIDGPLFSTSAADLTYSPLSLIVGGEIMPVSAISGGTSPQTFTVTRTLAKNHLAGASVQVYRPLIAAY